MRPQPQSPTSSDCSCSITDACGEADENSYKFEEDLRTLVEANHTIKENIASDREATEKDCAKILK